MNYFQKENIGVAWILLAIGFCLIFFSLSLSSCKTNIPVIDVSFWAGDSAHTGITRSQDHETIACSNPQFDEYACLTYSDLNKIWDTMLTCQQWPSESIATRANLRQMSHHNSEVLIHVFHPEGNHVPDDL